MRLNPLAAPGANPDAGLNKSIEFSELQWRRRELNSPRNPKKTLEFRVVRLLGGFIPAVH